MATFRLPAERAEGGHEPRARRARSVVRVGRGAHRGDPRRGRRRRRAGWPSPGPRVDPGPELARGTPPGAAYGSASVPASRAGIAALRNLRAASIVSGVMSDGSLAFVKDGPSKIARR